MSLAGKTANFGEWSEIYVFLKLLGEGRLYSADENLQRNHDCYVEILKIFREETKKLISEYSRDVENESIDIIIAGNFVKSVPILQFIENANNFFNYLSDYKKNHTSSSSSERKSVPVSDEMAAFSEIILVSKAKAPSLESCHGSKFGGKTDIVLRMRDNRSSLVSTMGFSIKSHLAQPPTLYNAGNSTQFLYEIEGMDDDGMNLFHELAHSKSNPWTKVSELYKSRNWNARFIGTANPVTSDNLFFIRDSMESIMACVFKHALLEDYTSEGRSLTGICKYLCENNPLNFRNTAIYEKAIKDFLIASFAGMTGAKQWDGSEQVNGGYIVVLKNGDVLCYHSSDRELFRNYLFNENHIEYVSRSKYKWGTITKDAQGRYILPLNASVRFYDI